MQHCETVMLARKWLNASVSCFLAEANGSSSAEPIVFIFFLPVSHNILDFFKVQPSITGLPL